MSDEEAKVAGDARRIVLDEHQQLAVLWDRWANHARDINYLMTAQLAAVVGIVVILVTVGWVSYEVWKTHERVEAIARTLREAGVKVAAFDGPPDQQGR